MNVFTIRRPNKCNRLHEKLKRIQTQSLEESLTLTEPDEYFIKAELYLLHFLYRYKT